MPAQWTADLIGEMHLHGITAKHLAEVAGLHEKYLSAVLNGHRTPKDAETKLREAMAHIIEDTEKLKIEEGKTIGNNG